MKKVTALLATVAAIAMIWVVGCETLEQRAQVVSPVVKYTPPIVAPDGTVVPGGYTTNWVTHQGTAVNPELLGQTQGILNTLGPWGNLAGTLLALGAAAYVRTKNTKELAKHIAEEHPRDDGK